MIIYSSSIRVIDAGPGVALALIRKGEIAEGSRVAKTRPAGAQIAGLSGAQGATSGGDVAKIVSGSITGAVVGVITTAPWPSMTASGLRFAQLA